MSSDGWISDESRRQKSAQIRGYLPYLPSSCAGMVAMRSLPRPFSGEISAIAFWVLIESERGSGLCFDAFPSREPLSAHYPSAGQAFARKRHGNERPVRGDNRTGQSHMGAWGGWALAPDIADGEGLPLPHLLVARASPTFKMFGDFFNSFFGGAAARVGGFAAENHREAG
jgi:hypothetical protein